MLLSAVCYAMMVTVMTPTPIVMEDDGFSFTESSTVIQLHLGAMFAPSFFTGDLIKASSARLVAYSGTALMMCSFVMCMLGHGMLNFAVGLVLLGLGWNGGFVGATVMLAQSSPPAHAERLQGINDTVMFALSATGVLLSAAIVESELGWLGLLWISMGCTATTLCVVLVLHARESSLLGAEGVEDVAEARVVCDSATDVNVVKDEECVSNPLPKINPE